MYKQLTIALTIVSILLLITIVRGIMYLDDHRYYANCPDDYQAGDYCEIIELERK